MTTRINSGTWRLLGTAVLALLMVSGMYPARGQAAKKKEPVVPLDPSVMTGKLKNGLTYYIQRNTEPQKRAELYLVTRVGSTAEDDDQQGLAHFTEHMAFNGTRDYPKNELISYLEKAGIRFGADLNAYTSFNETVYQLPLPTDSAALFEAGFNILANWAGRISFENEEIDKERGVIVEEDRQRGKNAGERMRNQLLPVLLANSRYNERLPIGKVDIIQSFDYKTLRRFYTDWYRPDLQAVIAVGDFDPHAVKKLIEKNFSSLQGPKKKRTPQVYPLPPHKEPLVKVVTDPEYPYTVANIIYKHAAAPTRTAAGLRQSALAGMINLMFSSRVQEIMQSGQAPFVQASGQYGSYQGGIGHTDAFTIGVVAKNAEGLKPAVDGIMTEVARMTRYGFTASELDRARKNMMASVERQFNERDKTPSVSLVKQYVDHFTDGEAAPGIAYFYDFYKEILPAVTLDEVNRFAAGFVRNENYIALIQAPEKEAATLPDTPTYLAWIRDAGKDVQPYEDNVSGEALMAARPLGGNIVQSKELTEAGATEWKLSNGATVVLKPTDFKNDEIILYAISPGGTSLAPDVDYFSANVASGIISSSGLGAFNQAQVQKMLSGKQVRISPFIGDHFEGLSGSATPKDLETAFQLTWLYLTKPRSDSSVFNMNMDRYKVSLAGRAADPNAVYQDTIRAVMSNYHLRGMTPTLADLGSITLDKAYRFYQDRFSDISDFTFIVVGNFTLDSIRPLVTTYLASLPGTQRDETYTNHHIAPVPGAVKKSVYKGLEDKAIVTLFFHREYDYNLQNNLMLDLLQTVLKTKLTERLREKEGAAYSPGTNVNYSKIPSPDYTLTVQFSCATDNVGKLVDATLDEIEKLKTNGATAEDIGKFVAQEKRQLEVQKRQNNFWLSYLRDLYMGLYTEDHLANYTESLEHITPDMTRDAARKFLANDALKDVQLLPEKILSK